MSTMPPVLEKKILSKLLFTESYDTIVEETKEKATLVGSVLKELIKQKLVTPMEYSNEEQDYKPTFMYDADNMRAYRYRITASGLKFLGK